MDWPLFLQITIPFIAIIVTVALFYLSRREKVVIQYPHMEANLRTNGATGVELKYSFSLLYLRGTRSRYINEIWLEFDNNIWKKLNPYFEIYLRVTRGFNLDNQPKLEIGKPEWFGDDYFFPVRGNVVKEELEKLESLVNVLWYRYKIGWRDTYNKSNHRNINQLKETRKSFREAM